MSEFEQILHDVKALRNRVKEYSKTMELSLTAPCNACHEPLEMDSNGINSNHICEAEGNN